MNRLSWLLLLASFASSGCVAVAPLLGVATGEEVERRGRRPGPPPPVPPPVHGGDPAQRGRPPQDPSRARTPSQPNTPAPRGDATEVGQQFVPEVGARVSGVTIPEAGYDPITRATWLYTTGRTGPQVNLSNDGLTFGEGARVTSQFANDPRRTRLPDGRWRRYYTDDRVGGLVSETSADGVTFTLDVGRDGAPIVRYRPTEADNGKVVYPEAFADRSGGVVLLYIGDTLGLNNIRRAYSSDGGETFQFDRGDLLGDAGDGGGSQSFIDPAPVRLPDGRIRLYVMRGGFAIHSFISADDGRSFTYEGQCVHKEDWEGLGLAGIFDPTVVPMADGGYRMYVGAQAPDGRGGKNEMILSAVSR